MTIKMDLPGLESQLFEDSLLPGSQWTPGMSSVDQLLIIDGREKDYSLYKSLLTDAGHGFSEILNITRLEDAYEYLLDHTPRCCILDYSFPDGTARELLSRLSKKTGVPNFPILISVESGNEVEAIELMQLGVQDFLLKDTLTSPVLMASLNNAINTFVMRNQLRSMAHYDSLTGMLSRSLFLNRLEHAVNEAKRYNRSLQLLYLDIDYFKQINETYGHAVGDTLLATVAGRIRSCVRETDSLGRVSGDEFALLLTEATVEDGRLVAEKILKTVGKPVMAGDLILQTNLSIGISGFPDTADDHHDLMVQANHALQKAKDAGRSRFLQFKRNHSNIWKRKITLGRAFPQALFNRELCLAYQPIFNTKREMPFSIETLVRWHFQGQWVEPAEIMELVQRSNQQIQFHEWLFRESLSQLKSWQSVNPDLTMSINLPGDLIQNQLILDSLYEITDFLGLDPASVILEITEINLTKQPEYTRNILNQLSNNGFRIAIDNFGIGFTSMEMLADLPCHFLKIDKSFFHNLRGGDRKLKMIDAITALGHRLGLKVVASGIENEHSAELADQAGCDSNQGYWYGRPVLGEPDLEGFLRRSKEFCGQIAPDLDYVSH